MKRFFAIFLALFFLLVSVERLYACPPGTDTTCNGCTGFHTGSCVCIPNGCTGNYAHCSLADCNGFEEQSGCGEGFASNGYGCCCAIVAAPPPLMPLPSVPQSPSAPSIPGPIPSQIPGQIPSETPSQIPSGLGR